MESLELMTTFDEATFAGADWMITPAAHAANEQPSDIQNQKWLLTLSGIVHISLKGANEWKRQTVFISPDIDHENGPLKYAVRRFSIPEPQGFPSPRINFQVSQMAALVSLASIFDEGHSVNAGFAVDRWRPRPYHEAIDLFTNRRVPKLFSGLSVDLGARDKDAQLLKVSYHISILGRIFFTGENIRAV